MLRTALLGVWLMGFSAGCAPATDTDTDTAPPDTTAQQQAPAENAQGIDVSQYQGEINWAEVRAAAMAFAFIKATEGETLVDPTFETNWAQAKQQGLLRGAYHFYRPQDDATTQAHFFLSTVGFADGDLPPVVDIEVTDGVAASEIVAGLQTWLSVVADSVGRSPIIYTDLSFWNALSTDALSAYPLWIAEYGVDQPTMPEGWTQWQFWQYSDSGQVNGVAGAVDLDVFNGTAEALKRWTE